MSQSTLRFHERYNVVHLNAPGVRFVPTDQELITEYLQRKLRGEELPCTVVQEYNVYACHPLEIANAVPNVGDNWYVLSPRDRKYANGKRPRRSTGTGFWKATGANEVIRSSEEDKMLGQKRALAFYEGSQKKRIKTEWKMVEYVTDESEKPAGATHSMLLNDWVLCKISYKEDSKVNGNAPSQYMQEEEEAAASEEQMVPDVELHEDVGLHEALNQFGGVDNYFFPKPLNPSFPYNYGLH